MGVISRLVTGTERSHGGRAPTVCEGCSSRPCTCRDRDQVKQRVKGQRR